MKVQLSLRQKISIGLIATGVIGLIVSTVAGVSDLMTVYSLAESSDGQNNSMIARQLEDIEMRTQVYNVVKIVGVLVIIIGTVLLYVLKHNRSGNDHRV